MARKAQEQVQEFPVDMKVVDKMIAESPATKTGRRRGRGRKAKAKKVRVQRPALPISDKIAMVVTRLVDGRLKREYRKQERLQVRLDRASLERDRFEERNKELKHNLRISERENRKLDRKLGQLIKSARDFLAPEVKESSAK